LDIPPPSRRLALGSLRIDLEQGTVDSSDGPSGLTPRAEDLLLLLCRSPNKLVTREQIHDTIWAGRVVEEATVTNTIWQIRKAIGEHGKDVLQTRAKRGYVLLVAESAWSDESIEASIEPGIGAEASQAASISADSEASYESPALVASKSSFKTRTAMLGFACMAILVVGIVNAPDGVIDGWLSPKTAANLQEDASRTGAGSASVPMRLAADVEMTVSVSVPDKLDWVRNAVLRAAVEQAYLRDSDVIYFEKPQRRNPFSGPHLQVELQSQNASHLVAALSLNQADSTVRETFRGPAHDLEKATARFIARTLQPPARERTEASDRYVSGRVAGLRFDYLGALTEYRRAIALDPEFSSAAIAMAALLIDMGREREALDLLVRLENKKSVSSPGRCQVDRMIVQVAPERLRKAACASAITLDRLERRESREVLREIGARKGTPVGAGDWLRDETSAIDAHLNLEELTEVEYRIVQAERIAEDAGWRRAHAEIGAFRGRLALHQGRVEDATRAHLDSAARMEATGDVFPALILRTFAIRSRRPVPGPMTAEQRTSLRQIIDRARSSGSVRGEIGALQMLIRLDRDKLPAWRADMERIRQLIGEAYLPKAQVQEEQFLINEYLAQRQFHQVIDGIAKLQRGGATYPQAQIWNLTLKAEALFPRDELDQAMATVDAMEKENFDIRDTNPCMFAWLFTEAGRSERARLILKKCPYEGYDRAGRAARGDFGLLGVARSYELEGEPGRGWKTLQPRIDELLAMPDPNRQEGESLALLARHATAMPGADMARLRQALAMISAMAAKDGAGPGLRFGVHLLRWRLCIADRRSDCGPILPAWAQEDRFEARLASEYQQSLRSRSPN
jgi:DNA-binding winged helix-turn-helix (wHTH) protein